MLKDTMREPHVDAANSEIISTTLFNSDNINEPGRVSACTISSCDETADVTRLNQRGLN
jgi:hypothetical protein